MSDPDDEQAGDGGDFPGDLGFAYEVNRKGVVTVHHHDRPVTTLRNDAALDFLDRMSRLDRVARQQWMARVTGNYKRGNERKARRHPRNR